MNRFKQNKPQKNIKTNTPKFDTALDLKRMKKANQNKHRLSS